MDSDGLAVCGERAFLKQLGLWGHAGADPFGELRHDGAIAIELGIGVDRRGTGVQYFLVKSIVCKVAVRQLIRKRHVFVKALYLGCELRRVKLF